MTTIHDFAARRSFQPVRWIISPLIDSTFLIGSVFVVLQGIAQFMIFAPGFGLMHQQDWSANDHGVFALVSSGISFVGHGLMAFGLLSFAIVHLRRTRMEKVMED